VSSQYQVQKEENIMKATIAALAALALVTATQVSAHDSEPGKSVQLAGSKDAKVTLVYQHALPGVPGKSIKGVLVEYGPGGYSPSHMHAKSAIIYATVIEGEVLSKVNDGPVTRYRTGENWTELPGDHHGVSANARDTHPAKILAVFVVDDHETELTIPDSK
jgi:quercetin dioxygenase-like cupin family protein